MLNGDFTQIASSACTRRRAQPPGAVRQQPVDPALFSPIARNP
jgi:hypothetical protein